MTMCYINRHYLFIYLQTIDHSSTESGRPHSDEWGSRKRLHPTFLMHESHCTVEFVNLVFWLRVLWHALN